MNLERIVKGLCVSLVLCGILILGSPPVSAQQDQRNPARQDRAALQPPQLRVAQPKVDPELEALLRQWADATEKIEKLQGTHYRWEYDKVYEIEKRAQGMFYYEAPDKGRIDIEGMKIEKDAVSDQHGRNGQPYRLESASPERWICNGKEIQKIDDKEKTAEIIPIPKEAQGPNIMDGPLPFLFGMPPEKAKQRYRMKIVKRSSSKVMLEIEPLQRHDAENWRLAKVILDTKEFLPEAVKLEDPSGNIETSYRFMDLEKNKRQNLFKLLVGEDIFQPKLRGYNTHVVQPNMVPGDPQQKGAGFVPGTVPRVTHMHAKKAAEMLKNAGYKVKYEAGKAVAQDEIVHTVYEQQPKAGTPLKKDEVVRITYYDFGRTAAKPAPEDDASRE